MRSPPLWILCGEHHITYCFYSPRRISIFMETMARGGDGHFRVTIALAGECERFGGKTDWCRETMTWGNVNGG